MFIEEVRKITSLIKIYPGKYSNIFEDKKIQTLMVGWQQ